MREDGALVEVATIGREGVVGVSAAWDVGAAPSLAMVQAEADTCYRMTVAAFRHEMDRRGAFYELHGHYAQALVGFIMQATACNAAHTVEQGARAVVCYWPRIASARMRFRSRRSSSR